MVTRFDTNLGGWSKKIPCSVALLSDKIELGKKIVFFLFFLSSFVFKRVKSIEWHGMVGTAAERKLRRHEAVHNEKNARLAKEREERQKRALGKQQLQDERVLRQAKLEADKRARKLQVRLYGVHKLYIF